MNKVFIIGNLTKAPELKSTKDGTAVCTFTVAVNKQTKNEQGADYFRVTTWRGLADNCSKFLDKGRKIAVVGSISLNVYTGNDGQTRASMEINASEVEFLSPRNEGNSTNETGRVDQKSGMEIVEPDENDLPF